MDAPQARPRVEDNGWIPTRSVPAATHYVFLRCWPGFAESFPYLDFNGLPDDEALCAVRHAVAVRLWSNRREIVEKRKVCHRKWMANLRKQARSVTGPPAHAYRHATAFKINRRLHHVYWGEGRMKRFVGLARTAGWHTGNGAPMYVHDRSYLLSPRVWLVGVADQELAEAIVSDLSSLTPRSDIEAQQRHFLNPHFGIALAGTMSRGERAAIIADIDRLKRGSNESAWHDVAKPFLSVAASIVASWRLAEIGQQQVPVKAPSEPGVVEAPPKRVLPAHQRAFLSFKYAEQRNGKRLKDDDAFSWLEENGCDIEDAKDFEEYGSLTDYELPARQTWLTYVSRGRSAAGEKKKDSRVGRTGRSITKYDRL